MYRGDESMKKRNDKTDVSANIVPIVMILFGALMFYNNGKSTAALFCVALLFLYGLAALVIRSARRGKASPAAVKAKAHEPQTSAKPDRSDDHKDALRCTCSHGRQRYLDQAELFLKNGIIDRAEYNVMRERYLKMELPDES